ncbi:hypothetical protein JB92DRAFT_3102324 [Gautieria morchelliformis]|nr:hypothetical protein JB92DRAFT_3102324 [Gautieria morchelliformis]
MNYLGRSSLHPILRASGSFPSKTTMRHSSRQFSSSSSFSTNTPHNHTPDTYQKDDTISEPSSSITNVVSGSVESDSRIQRPFESPTGAYTTTDASKPYDVPTKTPEEQSSKSRYGGINDAGAARDVNADDGPQDGGKTGRQTLLFATLSTETVDFHRDIYDHRKAVSGVVI